MNKPYHNKGFFPAFIVIVLGFFILPLVLMMGMDDTFERFTNKYFPRAECWETAKHERVCKRFNNCKFMRNFCHDEWGTRITTDDSNNDCIYIYFKCMHNTGDVMSLNKQKKSKKEILTDVVVFIIVVGIIGGMLLYAHYDIKEIVNG